MVCQVLLQVRWRYALSLLPRSGDSSLAVETVNAVYHQGHEYCNQKPEYVETRMLLVGMAAIGRRGLLVELGRREEGRGGGGSESESAGEEKGGEKKGGEKCRDWEWHRLLLLLLWVG